MTGCDPFIEDGFVFPRRPVNRPALDRIGYRIGEYPDMVEAMMRSINGRVELAAWTHRGADDPGIALLQGVAILGDILSFYQERYANEAYLRTAGWRESVADLVRLLGYRLAPGLGGRATVAFEAKGTRPIQVPAGFPLKAEIEGGDQPAEFQTAGDLAVWPHLSRFHLYLPRQYASYLGAGARTLEVASAGGNSTLAAIAALDLKAGDRIMLLPAEPGWTLSGSGIAAEQDAPQTLKVKAVRQVLGRTIVDFETPLRRTWTRPVYAYRLGRSFRHFGHAAPPVFTRNIKGSGNKITGAREKTTQYERHVNRDHDCEATSSSLPLDPRVIPLDQEVDDLMIGTSVIVETRVRRFSTARSLAVRKTVRGTRVTSVSFGAQTGPATLMRMSTPLLRNDLNASAKSDVRDYRIHEVTSPRIELRPVARGRASRGGAFASGLEALAFYGTHEEVKALANRKLSLVHEDGRVVSLTCANEARDFAPPPDDDPRMWTISFDAAPRPFLRIDFGEETPRVTVFGNLVEVTEGKAAPAAVLGNGDARSRFQTFRIPKPLTYHLSPGATPPQVPALTVHVNGRAWRRVASLFGQAPDAQVYVVREDAEGASYVQFGDGRTGARLPSGVGNVTATYRTGAGARGPLKPDTTPSPGQRIEGLTKLRMPEGVAGGADPEQSNVAREAAPGKVQGLDRLVSLRDYETELLTIPGVSRVAAAWEIEDGVPLVLLRVLLETGREAEFEAVRATIRDHQRCRGPDRFVIRVQQAFLRQIFLDLRYAFDPALIEADVGAAIRAALAPMGAPEASRKGLFALRARQLGGPEYASRVEGAVQRVAGVTWCRVTGFGLFPRSDTPPDELPLPGAPRPRYVRLLPAANELLQLHGAHLTLSPAPGASSEDCA